jgi:UDP-N-acetyl-D-glucosamine/UDP-N-acetyl-D-galactosamine dehydrogenase
MFATEPTLCIIGLGYVGLPLAAEFGKQMDTIGFDIDRHRVEQLRNGVDHTRELDHHELVAANQLRFTCDEDEIRGCNVYIVTVPTPINDSKQPDLTALEKASTLLGRVIGKNSLVVFESTVFPGCTEDICIPIIEQGSGLVFNRDFFAGYSPERINPGDKQHRVHNIVKVTSGSTPEAAEYLDNLYKRIVTAGTHKASSIKVAEAAKVIENTQRDINIALINELALICNRMGIDTLEVLEAAGTKWNFLPFRPGLVGGHCISVDPYYLTHKAQQLGYNPEVILAGRRINDRMGEVIAGTVVKLMARNKIHLVGASILVMGLAFKENCPDLRNTRVVDIVRELETYHTFVHVYDPWADPEEAKQEYDLELVAAPCPGTYDAIILCVGHDHFKKMGGEVIRALGKPEHILFDVKHVLPKHLVDGRL